MLVCCRVWSCRGYANSSTGERDYCRNAALVEAGRGQDPECRRRGHLSFTGGKAKDVGMKVSAVWPGVGRFKKFSSDCFCFLSEGRSSAKRKERWRLDFWEHKASILGSFHLRGQGWIINLIVDYKENIDRWVQHNLSVSQWSGVVCCSFVSWCWRFVMNALLLKSISYFYGMGLCCYGVKI